MRNLYIIFSFCILASCSNDDDTTIPNIDDIYGSWEKIENISNEQLGIESNHNYAIKQELHFYEDKSFTWLVSIINTDNSEILGYIRKEEGLFSQNENKLIFLFDRFESERNSISTTYQPTTIENLILADQNIEFNYNFKLLNDNRTLLFDFPICGPDTTCQADIELNRVD